MVTRWSYKNTPNLATLTNTSMASYYPSPSTPFSGAARSSTPDTRQRPPSALMEKLNLYPSDASVYAGTPQTASPLQPYPISTAKFPGRSYSPRPESPAQIGRPTSGFSFPQAPESPLPVQRTFKTFLQWKAEAQATTADYQRNGFPSPVAWVLLLPLLPPTQLTYHVDICRGSRHPSKCHSWRCRPQGAVEYCPSILRGHILSIPTL